MMEPIDLTGIMFSFLFFSRFWAEKTPFQEVGGGRSFFCKKPVDDIRNLAKGKEA